MVGTRFGAPGGVWFKVPLLMLMLMLHCPVFGSTRSRFILRAPRLPLDPARPPFSSRCRKQDTGDMVPDITFAVLR